MLFRRGAASKAWYSRQQGSLCSDLPGTSSHVSQVLLACSSEFPVTHLWNILPCSQQCSYWRCPAVEVRCLGSQQGGPWRSIWRSSRVPCAILQQNSVSADSFTWVTSSIHVACKEPLIKYLPLFCVFKYMLFYLSGDILHCIVIIYFVYFKIMYYIFLCISRLTPPITIFLEKVTSPSQSRIFLSVNIIARCITVFIILFWGRWTHCCPPPKFLMIILTSVRKFYKEIEIMSERKH
jgi:hypothetical protein